VKCKGNHSRETPSEVSLEFFISKMNSNGFGSNILVFDGKNWER